MTIRPKIRALIDIFCYLHTTIRRNYMVLFHLFVLLWTTIRPKVRVVIDLFLLFAHNHLTKIYGLVSFILSLCTTIRSKIRVLINLFFYLYTTIQPKLGRGHCYSLIYSFLNSTNILFAIFMAVLPLYFVCSISDSTAFISRPLFSQQYYPYILYTIFMAI